MFPAQHVPFCFQGREQDVSRIIQALNECLAALPQQQLRKVKAIGVSGQMHGILLWEISQGMLGSGDGLICCVGRGPKNTVHAGPAHHAWGQCLVPQKEITLLLPYFVQSL